MNVRFASNHWKKKCERIIREEDFGDDPSSKGAVKSNNGKNSGMANTTNLELGQN